MKKYVTLFILIILALIPLGCSDSETVDNKASSEIIDEDKENQQTEIKSELDYAKIQPNEAGQIMVLMYHSIAPEEGTWTRTPENFRNDLENLYHEGYRLVPLRDVILGDIDIEAGKTPVVLTFDDGTLGHFNYIKKDGELVIDPDSAVGIILEINEKYPDFGTAATFYINSNPFRQPEFAERKLRDLVNFGMDIGNHTYNHMNMSEHGSKEIQKQMAKVQELVNKSLPDYSVDTLALPFGIWPQEQYRRFAISGEYEGITYENIGVLEVGSHPSFSPFHKDFDPLSIPRVRASYEEGYGHFKFFFNNYQKDPSNRYISDGDSDYITVPEELEDKIDMDRFPDKKLRTYNLDKEQ
ncbi:polysaccharide deacetylase family protein [Proteinivorax tanatarense]|uniref:Polysaccharide deacetylase family protein n=1 Tax=Proteinivorax tanatarense TaxID=1260629 RepID=A0AAU7VKW8_9FIRM